MEWSRKLLTIAMTLAACFWVWQWLQRPVTTKIWRPSMPGFVHPELKAGTAIGDYLNAKDSFGVALAGGGPRGMGMGHGIARAMRDAGLLQKARYLSTTSGSVWFGIPLYYQTLDTVDDFFGKTMDPEHLEPEVLVGDSTGTMVSRLSGPIFRLYPKGVKKPRRHRKLSDLSTASHGIGVVGEEPTQQHLLRRRELEASLNIPNQTIDHFFHCASDQDWCSCLVSHGIPNIVNANELWTLLTALATLHPYNLAGPRSSHCHREACDRVRSELGHKRTIYIARDMEEDLPFLISQSALIAPFTRDPVLAWPLEQTPLYAGIAPGFTGTDAGPFGAVGDVLIEPFAYPGTPLDVIHKVAEQEVKRVKIHPDIFSVGQLAEWGGMATAYVADFQTRPWAEKVPKCEIAVYERFMPHADNWSPLDIDPDTQLPVTHRAAMGDAGVYDDLGHLPLLRRGIKKIVMFDSSAIKNHLCEMVYTYAAFGQPGCLNPPDPAGAPNPNAKANMMNVFSAKDWPALNASIHKAWEAGEPAIVRGNYTVLDNPTFGIKGGWQVEIVWVILLPSKTWQSKLPNATRAGIEPFFPTYLAAATNDVMTIGAMSQYGSWVANLAMPEIRAMLGDNVTLADVEAALTPSSSLVV